MTDSNTVSTQTTTSVSQPRGQAERDEYYHTFNLFDFLGHYKPRVSSTDYNPLLKSVWHFSANEVTELYENDWSEWINLFKSMIGKGTPLEQEKFRKDCKFLIDRAQHQVTTHENQEELFIHDQRVTGVSGDWKEIRQLYRKLKNR